ncbi:MFS transporter [Streptomyces spongiae]|uniref:MFS transporter n=1 Tax=Streptomyces spongiae TaxID=565072 RepID=A0A5N8XN79_9ACTN|nr:MFS transporter [Streptomyces spongiae]MPY59995.1 MFS transporter [Streptomyces spongiae]
MRAPTAAGPTTPMEAAAPHRRLTLAGSVLGAVIVALDGTVLTIAQPTLQRELGASFTQVQWTSTGYLIAVASLLVFAGRLGDRYGHHRVFAAGILGFGAASAGIGCASGVGWVIALRVAQGVFGALLQPATLGMLRAVYPPDRLGMPLALRTSAIGVAAAAGPLVGGVLVTHLGWRSVFFLNVVPALVLGLLALTVRAPARPRTGATGLDLPGACLLAVALGALVHTLVGVPGEGSTAGTVLGLFTTVGAAVAFVRRERRTTDPLLPPGVLGSGTVGAALGALVAASAAMLGTMFVSSYALQDVLGLDPLRTSLTALPGAVAMVPAAPLAAVLLRRWGARPTAFLGMGLLSAGVLALSRIGEGTSTVVTGGGFLLVGAGFGTVMVTATTVVVRDVPAESAGVAGGLQQTALNIGPTLGVAVATTVIGVSGGVSPGPALLALTCGAALGGALCLRLPGRGAPTRVDSPSVRDHEREDVREP